jgi:hypothetical protein
MFFEEEFDLLDAFIGEGQDPVVIVSPTPTVQHGCNSEE